jgi:glutathione S-transferase
MKLFYARGACSLADHIAMEEAGFQLDIEAVDLHSKRTESGADYMTINPKGYVPALVLDNCEMLTENLAILDWIASQSPSLGLEGPLGRTRLLEVLAYLSAEVHKSFKPLFVADSEQEAARARQIIANQLKLLASGRAGPYLFGMRPSVADCYLFVMLIWAAKFGVTIPDAFNALGAAMTGRHAVQVAMAREGMRIPIFERQEQKRAGVA